MALLENKKQLYYCISVIRNRISISLNIISKHIIVYKFDNK